MSPDRLHDRRHAMPAVAPHPAPVVGALAPAADGAPRAPQEAEVEHNDGVGGPQPDRQPVIAGPEVAVQDPCVTPGQVTLAFRPAGRVRSGDPLLPGQRVQLGHGQSGQLAEPPGQDRLARTATPDDHYPPHTFIMAGKGSGFPGPGRWRRQ